MATLTRRSLLRGAGLASVATLGAGASWAEVGAPALVAAARARTATTEHYRLLALDAEGQATVDLALPARGHAAAVHPHRARVVAFARRPGTFALVLDCATGRVEAELSAPEGRHFYGHGCYTADAGVLFTTENAYASGEGRIGLWDATTHTRLGEVPSGGLGPHDMALLPDGRTLVVANGGIRTHPDSGRDKLNLDTMRPNLSYLDATSGALLDSVELPEDLHLNSIRHLAVARDGLVAAALQWQGAPTDSVPLLAFHRRGWTALRLAEADVLDLAAMRGYAGSVAFDAAGRRAAITSPRGGRVMAWNVPGPKADPQPDIWYRADVCGIAPRHTDREGWIATDGLGGMTALSPALVPQALARHRLGFDNHLIALQQSS